ncbi:MAG: AAA family ATPase [Candidatus Methanomethylophilaceae archaeon]|nr:AAA family ATPase [Candidatus Methanomethylophilaceae archaeon]
MARALPIGVQDFKEIRDSNLFYIDKSDMISQILSEGAVAYLYTRPRRFGKSLNLSMLDAFFNIRYPKDNKWFDGLKVTECKECQEHKNAYPVIYFDFKELGVASTEMFDVDLKLKISDLYRQHKYILNSEILDDLDKQYFKDVLEEKVEPLKLRKSISALSRMLCEHHGKKVIVLFDEYDNPMLNAYGKEFHRNIIQFMKDIMTSVFKGNESLEFGVITGITQIAKESIFSGLNNLKVDNILSTKYDEMFGFTNDEVKSICTEYGHPEKYPEAKEWYDGYRFGDADIYNPWSVINYIDEGFKPQTYWAGTSGNSILNDLFELSSHEMWSEFRRLAQRERILYTVTPTITFQDIIANERNIYSMLVMSGYLTARVEADGRTFVSIPNGEMANVFGNMIMNRMNVDSVYVGSLSKAFISGNESAIEQYLYDMFASSAGNAMLNDEHSYQAFITGMLMYLFGKYSVKADFEEGNGRYDIRLERKYGDFPNVVIEIKRISTDSSDETATSVAEKALEQIRDKDYLHGLTGNTLLYGIAFRNKKPTVLSERMVL